MAFDAVRAKTASVLEQAFAASAPGTLVVMENHKFTRQPTQPWVYVSMQPGVVKRKNIGTRKREYRRMGIVIVNIMVPVDSGSKALYDLSEIAFTAIADRNFNLGADGYLKLCDATQKNRGVINGFLTWNIQVEYHHDMILDKPADA
jgi:hypothetical protein